MLFGRGCGDTSTQRHMFLCQKGELPTVGRGIVGAPSGRGQVSRGLVYDRRRREMDRWYAAAPSVVDILLYRCGEGRAESGGKSLPSSPRAKAVLGFGVFGRRPRGGDCGHKGPGLFLTAWRGFAFTVRPRSSDVRWEPTRCSLVSTGDNRGGSPLEFPLKGKPQHVQLGGAPREKNQNLLEVIYIPPSPGMPLDPALRNWKAVLGGQEHTRYHHYLCVCLSL